MDKLLKTEKYILNILKYILKYCVISYDTDMVF